MFCTHCGSPLRTDACYCTVCGAAVGQPPHARRRPALAILGLILAFCCVAGLSVGLTLLLSHTPEQADDTSLSERVDTAISILEEGWANLIADGYAAGNYLEIRSTRVVEILPNDNRYLSDIDYIVEFILYSDLYGSAPYYSNAGIYDSVLFYRDGSVDVLRINPIRAYSNTSYNYDYSDFLGEIYDFGAAYNQVLLSSDAK